MTATATEDRAQELLVQTPEESLLFMARRRDLRLVKTPRYDRFGAGGQKMGEVPGEAVAFRDGVLRVPREGKVTLEDGRQTDAADILEWLEGHRLNKDVNDGFWRVDPTAPPVSQEELRSLMEIAMALDEERLRVFIDQERNGWCREELLSTAEEALERLVATKAELTAQANGDGAGDTQGA